MIFPQSRVSGQISRLLRAEKKAREKAEREASLEPPRRPRRPKLNWKPLTQDKAEERWQKWFDDRDWKSYPFQREAWTAFRENQSTLISVPTGSGKTYAAFGGPLIKLMTETNLEENPLRVIYLTPLKALVKDVAIALERPCRELQLPFNVGVRTGDTTDKERREFDRSPPSVLVTTPESLAILLTRREAPRLFHSVFSVIIDEGHELLHSKRGSLLELTLSRLKGWAPQCRVTAVSATLGNLEMAAQVLTGDENPTLIREAPSRYLDLEMVLPNHLAPLPWFGYAGLHLVDDVLDKIRWDESQIIFTNTRAHAEVWYREFVARCPERAEEVALHHGSLSRGERDRVETAVKRGDCKVVIATSSLELGVDFPQVGQVFQIGSAKSLARAVQRGGRGYHSPEKSSSLALCPVTLFEIFEAEALRKALRAGVFEYKQPIAKPLDVFVQFLLNCALAGGFRREEIRGWLDRTYSFREITEAEIDWALQFLVSGGYSLTAYPQFRKLKQDGDLYVFTDPRLARDHRMNIGTIVDDDGIQLQYLKGGKLGTVSEVFISKLRKGDVFQFGGKSLEFVQLREVTAFVRQARKAAAVTTVWNGSLLPITPLLSDHIQIVVDEVSQAQQESDLPSKELKRFWPVAQRQKHLSHIPRRDEVLIEQWKSREGYHLFMYPWQGRFVHEGLGHLFAYRIARFKENTLSVAVNDYGFELLAAEPFPDQASLRQLLTSTDHLDEDIHASLNFADLAKRSFREVARVSGLVQGVTSGRRKNQRNLQMSSSLLYEVLEKYEPGHPLVEQAKREVKERQLHIPRLEKILHGFGAGKLVFQDITTLTPFSFPLYVERVRSRISTESLKNRIERFQRKVISETPS